MKRGFKTWAENQAVAVRRELGLKPNSPLPARTLAAHLHIEVIKPSDLPGISSDTLNQLLSVDGSSWSAATVVRGDRKRIVYNSRHSAPRLESDLMHEISHVLCRHDASRFVQPFAVLTCRTCNPEQEAEAAWLGGCLQIPRDGLWWAVNEGMSDEDVAQYFGASLDMARFRLRKTAVRVQLARMRAKRSLS